MRLANDKVATLYHSQPFVAGQPAQFVAGHWLWVARQGFGHGDIQATVELALDGSTNKVDLQLGARVAVGTQRGNTARVLPAFALAIPMEAKFLQFAPDFLEWRDIEFQPNPFADDLGLTPKLRHFRFQFIQQCKRVGHACGIGRHGYSLSCRPPVDAGCFWLGYSRWKRGRHFCQREGCEEQNVLTGSIAEFPRNRLWKINSTAVLGPASWAKRFSRLEPFCPKTSRNLFHRQ